MGRKIAIVGTGIAGLAAAHALHRDHDITVFEADDRPGGHANTVRVESAAGPVDVDTGFIVFNDRNYPRFERLLERLGVAWQHSEMSFSVSDGRGDFEYSGCSPNGLFAKRAHLVTPWFHRMVADLVRFNRQALELLRSEHDLSLRDWLEARHYSTPFIERLIVPQAAAVWSADPRQMWSFPARFMIEFFANHGMLGFRDRPQWRTVSGGSQRYVEAAVAPWRDRLRLSAPVREVRRHADHVTVVARGMLEPERYDDVIFATHSDQALALLGDPTDRERELLGAIAYQRNEAVLHTDTSLLPRRRRAWASWNYHLLDAPTGKPTLTYHMNRLQSLDSGQELCVTLNHSAAIDPRHVVRTIPYAHPIFTAGSVAAQARHHEISGRERTHYCGAYWGWGFHEDGVVSAERVTAHFGA